MMFLFTQRMVSLKIVLHRSYITKHLWSIIDYIIDYIIVEHSVDYNM